MIGAGLCIGNVHTGLASVTAKVTNAPLLPFFDSPEGGLPGRGLFPGTWNASEEATGNLAKCTRACCLWLTLSPHCTLRGEIGALAAGSFVTVACFGKPLQ